MTTRLLREISAQICILGLVKSLNWIGSLVGQGRVVVPTASPIDGGQTETHFHKRVYYTQKNFFVFFFFCRSVHPFPEVDVDKCGDLLMFNNSFDVTMQSLETTCPENDVSWMSHRRRPLILAPMMTINFIHSFISVSVKRLVLQASRFSRQPVVFVVVASPPATRPADTISKFA